MAIILGMDRPRHDRSSCTSIRRGGHGFGMNKLGLPVDSWIERFGEWLEAQGF